MEGPGKLFIFASFFYLALGPAVGFLMAYMRGKWVLRMLSAHTHINLLGWVSMMIFGFSYTFMPLLAGRDLYSETLPYVHFFLGNTGLIGMISVWIGSRFPKSPVSPALVWPFGLLVIISIWLYIFNMVMTFLG